MTGGILRGLDRLIPVTEEPGVGIVVGVVVADDPLMIRRLNESDEQAFQVMTWWTEKPVIGQRVWMIRTGTQYIVAGVHNPDFTPEPPPPLPGAQLVKTSNQTYSATTWTKVGFDSSLYADEASMADVANSRLLIPETGRYRVGASLNHPTTFGTAYQRTGCIVRGGSMPLPGSPDRLTMQNAFNSSDWYASLVTEGDFVAGEYVTLWFWCGVASNFGANSQSRLWISKVR